MIILCPNHHTEFDYGTIAIDPKDSITIIHKQDGNEFNNCKIDLKHKIGSEFILYHYNLFKQKVQEKWKNQMIFSYVNLFTKKSQA